MEGNGNPEAANKDLARKTVTGTMWVYSTYILTKGLVFIANIILARLLLPADFGLLALGLLVINFIDTMADFGVGNAVIYRQDDVERSSNNAFLITIGSSFLLTAAAFVIAPFAAEFFDEPRVTSVMRALSLAVLIHSLGGTQAARIKKELDFRRRFLPEIARAVIKGGVSIGLAVMGLGVWSLVWGQLAGTLAATLLYWVVSSWRPRFQFDLPVAREMIAYGWQMVLINLFGQLITNLDYAFIGRRMDTTQLGFYTIAFRVPELIILNICSVVSQAVFPAYAKLQNDTYRLRKGYLATLQYVSLITVPAGVGMALAAPEFVYGFYTERWAPAIPVMQLLALYTVVYSLAYNAGDIYKATGRPALLNKIAVFRLALTVPALWFSSQVSILAVAASILAVNLLITPVQLAIAKNITQSTWGSLFEAMKPSFVGSAVMGLAIVGLQQVLPPEWPHLVRLALIVMVGALVYAAALWVTQRALIDQALNLARSILRRRRASEGKI